MKATYFGHGSFLLKIAGKSFLIDPFISPNQLAKDIDIDSIETDYILLTHGHEDHVADVESIAKRTKAVVIANFEIANWFEKKGVTNNIKMNICSSVTLSDACVDGCQSVKVPNGRPSEPLGVHGLHGLKHAGVGEGALHDSDEIRFKVKVCPYTS